MKRLWISGLVAAVCTSAAAQPLSNAPVKPTPEPFSETQFGEQVDDPYHWMEKGERAADVSSFIRQSSAHSVAQLAKLPGRAQLRERIAAGVQAGVRYSDLREVGGQFFYRRTDPGAQHAKLVVRAVAGGHERILHDPEAGGKSGGSISSFSVSPDGTTLAFHVAGGGSEVGAIRFMDVASGRELADRLEPVWGEFRAEWLDNRTLAYTRMAAAGTADQMLNMRVYLHRLGEKDGPALLGAGVDGAPIFEPREFPQIEFQPGSDWAIGSGLGARADGRVMVARSADIAAGRAIWREIADYSDRAGATALDGDMLYLVSTGQAANGEILAIDLRAGGTLKDARVVMPGSDAILNNITIASDGIYVTGRTDGVSRLFFMARGKSVVEVDMPFEGNASGLSPADGGGVTLGLQDWFTAPRWFRVNGSKVEALGIDSASYKGMAGARQLRELATSADGTKVPLTILLPPGHKAGPAPLLLEGYASYGITLTQPLYAQWTFGLLESGGIIAYCGGRGGGERGRSWHEGGRAANKPNGQADLIACGERLVELGLTSPDKMTVMGTSAGGLLAPPAALKRPDLFGSLIANVAILNPTRLAVAENGANQFAEMGDPTTEAGYRGLVVQDSYRLLLAASNIPDTLITVGLNDRRVAPWFSAKFAARALDRFGGDRLVLIRTDPDAGHGIGSARDQLIEQNADVYSFVLSQAGAEGFANAP